MFFIWELLGGFVMGVANVIPGVSGGTMLLIMGLYEKFINSISLFAGKNRDFFSKKNLIFLFTIIAGLLIGVFSTSKLMNYLIINQKVPTYFFIIGLIIGSIDVITEKIDFKKVKTYIPVVIGVILMVLISVFSANVNSDSQKGLFDEFLSKGGISSYISFFIGGVFGAVAMLLPGISGSMLLVVFGLYSPVIEVVSDFKIVPILFIAAGVIIGIIVMSKVISILLKKYSNGTYSFILGLVLASIYTIWPSKNVSLETYSFVVSILCLIVGFAIGHYILKLEKNFSNKIS